MRWSVGKPGQLWPRLCQPFSLDSNWIGATARLDLLRGGSRVQAHVTAVELSPEGVVDLVARRTGLSVGEERLRGGTLLVVRRVERGSAAAQAGIAPSDLVREVNSAEVGSLAEFRKAAARARRSGRLVLLVQRGFAAERIAFDVD